MDLTNDVTPNPANLGFENSNNEDLVASLRTEIKTNTENLTQVRKMIEDFVKKQELKPEIINAVDEISANLKDLKINVEILNEKLVDLELLNSLRLRHTFFLFNQELRFSRLYLLTTSNTEIS